MCDYPLIGRGVSSMCFFLVPQNFLCVQVESFQLLDQLALLSCMCCALSVERLHLCIVTSTFTHRQNRLYEFIRCIVVVRHGVCSFKNHNLRVKPVCPKESAQSVLLTYKDTFNHRAKTLRRVSSPGVTDTSECLWH